MINGELQIFNETVLDKYTKNGYIIISSIYFEELKKDVRDNRFSYIPIFGEFIGNDGKKHIKSALFVPNYKIA